MDKLLIFFLCFHFCLAKITIKNLDVPASISVNEGEVILDCEFDDQDGDVEEVKWFFDGLVKQIYQWLPKRNMKPQALGDFRDYIDLTYKATKNTTTMYRALKLTNIQPELSGDYTCKVSGLKSEDYKTKRLIIYDPADYDLSLNATGNDKNLTVECFAEGIFPEPQMRILIAQYNETNVVIEHDEEDTELVEEDPYDTFNISAVLHVDLDELDSPIYYTCELYIPDTDYKLNETMIYEFDSEESEEDDLLHSTNSTDISDEESQEVETQIEENSENDVNGTAVNTSKNEDDDDDDDKNDKDNKKDTDDDDVDDDDDEDDDDNDNKKDNKDDNDDDGDDDNSDDGDVFGFCS